jgi:hypothetical protein
MRTYQQCFESLEKYILEPFSPDIFIHTWEQSGISHKERKNSDESIITYDGLRGLYDYKMCKIEKFESRYCDQLNGVIAPDILKEKEPNYKGSIPLFYKMFKCNQLKSQYEKENNFEYDIVIKYRPDLKLNRYLPSFDRWDIKEHNVVYMEADLLPSLAIQASDKLAFGNSKAMDIYSSVWRHLRQYWESPIGKTFHTNKIGERLMRHHIVEQQLTVGTFFADLALVRVDGREVRSIR